MIRLVSAMAAVVVVAAPLVAGCARNSDGTAVRATDAVTTPVPPSVPVPSTPESPVPGVVATTTRPVPADAVTCPMPAAASTVVAVVADPAAPRITVAVPAGWSSAPGSGDVGAQLTGPDGMAADVTVRATPLAAGAAFTRYADDAMAKYPISTLSVLPAELCGYSGQTLMGTWADNPDKSIQYADRIAHIWTGAKNYLVSIHVQAPSGTEGFDEAAAVLTGEPGVVIP